VSKTPFEKTIDIARRNNLPLWAVIDRVSRAEYDGDVPVQEHVEEQEHSQDAGLMREPMDDRHCVISKPDGTHYMERHTGSLRGIIGRIRIYTTHQEACEAMRDLR